MRAFYARCLACRTTNLELLVKGSGVWASAASDDISRRSLVVVNYRIFLSLQSSDFVTFDCLIKHFMCKR